MSDALSKPRSTPGTEPKPPRPVPHSPADDIPDGAQVLLAVIGIASAIALLVWGIPKGYHWARAQDWHHFTQWAATIDRPVHTYLAAHTTGLPITAASAYVLWQGIGLGSLALSWATGATGARLTWIAYGAATAWMVWDSSPATGRPVATALAALAWTVGSAFALRGLSLRPVIVNR
ncbi:hypothetical protein [Streptomyces abikoensis]|uniref:Integral membrane protein n=1 Tax=Streptomyces abikoensis TaxID=97398 RepID=A0ABW7TFZ3_9ACTN